MKLNFNLGFLVKKNRNDKENTKMVKCKTCGNTFQNKDRLMIHSKKAHTGREKPDTTH
jgi:uncharacterized C2H2 Zn-finger protein